MADCRWGGELARTRATGGRAAREQRRRSTHLRGRQALLRLLEARLQLQALLERRLRRVLRERRRLREARLRHGRRGRGAAGLERRIPDRRHRLRQPRSNVRSRFTADSNHRLATANVEASRQHEDASVSPLLLLLHFSSPRWLSLVASSSTTSPASLSSSSSSSSLSSSLPCPLLARRSGWWRPRAPGTRPTAPPP